MPHPMSMSTSAARACLLAALVCSAPRAATAVPASPSPTQTDTTALSAERARLRGELDRINAEIDALKQAHPGVGDDGRLRGRMADAEALARRLMDIESRLGVRAPAAKAAPLPVAAPTDGPTDLDAKADILSDQSRRVRLEADRLGRRVAELKARQDLRRRAADLDRDPFAPLEGSKRRGATAATPDSGSHAQASTPFPGLSTDPTGTKTATTGASAGGGPVPIGPAIPIIVNSGTTGANSPATTTSTTTLSIEVRDMLDPATVADIRRLEGTRTSAASLSALERAVAALHARADALDAQARAFRASSAAQK